MEAAHEVVEVLSATEHYASWRRAAPLTRVKSRMLALVGDTSHQYGVALGAQTVHEHGGERCGEACGNAVVVDEGVCRLCPFQQYVRALVGVERDESAVEAQTVCLEHTHRDVDASVAQTGNAAALHLSKGVYASHHDTLHALAHDEVGTWRRLAVV